MIEFWFRRLLLAAFFSASVFATAIAHKGASGVVKTRMDSMRSLKNEVKLIDDMLGGKKYLSQKRLARTLSNIEQHAGSAMIKLFPKGSHMKPSEADPLIWKSWDEFVALASTLETVTNSFRLRVQARSETSILKDDYLKMRAACKSCHDRFRL